MKKILLFTVLMLIASTSLLNAQRAVRSNTARQTTQQARISNGIRSNELTRTETKRLEREQRRIKIEKRIAKSDGIVTPSEKRFLRREQNRASKHIAKQKNDGQKRLN